jgi:dihydrofolate synthase/folylpolyglutamate synthase
MPEPSATYTEFLRRLQAHERVEPFPRNRRPDKLAGILRLVEALGHPERAYRVAHVAGTNGKGMTAAMLAALLRQAGRRVALYTSPHVLDLRERFAVDGRWLPEPALAAAGHRVLDLAAALPGGVYCSYFDLLTAIGLLAFRDAGAEDCVLETGLGGAADATNITPKALCILTRIGWDHMYVLGNSLREIAAEKLGIVRPGVPTVIAEQDPELMPWLEEQVRLRGSAPLRAEATRLEAHAQATAPLRVTWPDGERTVLPAGPQGLTAVKLCCAATALTAAAALLGPGDGPERVRRLAAALATTLPGRLEFRTRQRLVGGPAALPDAAVLERVVLDGGHNREALLALNDQLERWGVRDYTLIFGMQADKLVDAVRAPLGVLAGRAARVILLAPQTPRAPNAEALADFVAAAAEDGPRPEVCPDAAAALALAAQTPQRPLVAAGSFWMLGDLMRLLAPADAADTGPAASGAGA